VHPSSSSKVTAAALQRNLRFLAGKKKDRPGVSRATAAVAYRAGTLLPMSEKKSDNRTLDFFEADEFCSAESRERLVPELRAKAERFYEQASPEQIIEAAMIVRSLLAGRGLLPEQTSKQIH
jgi:hypothetical protein